MKPRLPRPTRAELRQAANVLQWLSHYSTFCPAEYAREMGKAAPKAEEELRQWRSIQQAAEVCAHFGHREHKHA